MPQKQYLTISDLRGGRNGSDPQLSLPDNQSVEAVNVDYYDSPLGKKRAGATSISMLFGSGGRQFTGDIVSLMRLDGTPLQEVLYAVDDSTVPLWGYLARSLSSWGRLTTTDDVASNPYRIEAASMNDRLYVCFDSAVDRLHVIENAATLRRCGLATPSAATAANVGSGSYAATIRYYKVAYTVQSSGVTTRRSELSSYVAFTPSGSGSSCRVTKPAAINEGETHWEIYASADNNLWWKIATTAVATSYYDDSTVPSTYSSVTGIAAPVVGVNVVPSSWKHIATNGNRLLGAGSWETGGKSSRVWYTSVLGSSDVGDLERVPPGNYVDLDEQNGDEITGIVGNYFGSAVVFKRNEIWKLIPTGDDVTPYRYVCMTRMVGCIEAKSIVQANDENGQPALYFLSALGPYRISTSGIEYCGIDIEDVWATVNQSAAYIVGHGVFYRQKHQIWYWLSVGSDTPNTKMVLDTRLCRRTSVGVRGGWITHTGASCTAAASIFSKAHYNPLVLDERPYVGSNATAATMMRCDTGTTDAGTTYQAYVTTKPYPLGGLGRNCQVGNSHLSAVAAENVTITQSLVRDYGLETRTSTCSLEPVANETRVQRQFEGSEMSGAGVVQITLGDAEPSSQAWSLDALMVPYWQREER